MRSILLAAAFVLASHGAYADPHDFTPEGKALLAVGACGDTPAPEGFIDCTLAFIGSSCFQVQPAAGAVRPAVSGKP